LLLALDTSANLCSAAVFDSANNRFVGRKSDDIGRGHAERLMGLLQELLDDGQLVYEDIGRIAVTIGPGSFTGIRVGIAAARGLAFGLDVPVVGIGVLDAIAFQHRQVHHDGPIVVAMDAKRDEIFLQVFDGGSSSGPANVAIADIAANMPLSTCNIAGSAADIVAAQSGRTDIHIISRQSAADIDAVAGLASHNRDWNEKPKPLYLRKADAKPQLDFAVAYKAVSSKQENGRF